MSVIEQELIESRISKKRVITTLIVAGILISAFAFSTALYSMILGSQRLNPNDELAKAEFEDAKLILPPFPFNLEDLLKDLSQEELEAIMDMLDGNIDNMDLAALGAAMAALLYSEVPVFRVYDYDNFNDMADYLWKYESYDEFQGDGWNNNFPKQLYSFTPLNDYYADYSDTDLLTLKMALEPTSGVNSLVIPSLFPNPHIIEDSVTAPNMDDASTLIYKTELNSTTLDVTFNDNNPTNMTYELFGLNLPSNDAINSSSLDESLTPTDIEDTYLQFPGGSLSVYLNNNPYFRAHYLTLQGIIKPSDTAFVVANKIRNYLQVNFNFGVDALVNNGPQDGEDVVEWFCEHEEGIWSNFASAFCVFGRAFDLSTRFIDGFNSRSIEEYWDDEESENGFVVKYKNMYSWAEVYIPTEADGAGMWVQMDIMYDSYGGGSPLSDEEFSLTLESDFISGYRPNTAQLNATLTSPTASVESRLISFTDLTTGQDLGDVYTDANGIATLNVPIDNTQVVGPHLIKAQYGISAANFTSYTIYGPVRVVLQSVNPNEVNRSITNNTLVQGYVDDPINGQRVKNATVEFALLNKGTNTKKPNPFNPQYQNTDQNGAFSVNLEVLPTVPIGEYEVRVDLNSTFEGIPIGPPGSIEDSSNKIALNITAEEQKYLWLYINNIDAHNAPAPLVNRYNSVTLSARLLNETFEPINGEVVEFYNVTGGKIGQQTTNFLGWANISHSINFNSISGPILVSAKVGALSNYSYFILNEKPKVNIISGPSPLVINRTAPGVTEFNVVGNITDATNNEPIPRTYVQARLYNGPIEKTTYLIPTQASPFLSNDAGVFDLTFGVNSTMPPGNYSVMIEFTGGYNRLNQIQYPYNFFLPSLSENTTLANDLRVEAPDLFGLNIWLNGTPNNDFNGPVISRNDWLNISCYVQWGGTPIADGETVKFWDLTNNISIGSATTKNGYTNFTYSIGSGWIAGVHLIRAEWNNRYNYSYYILDDNIDITLNTGPSPSAINRSGSIGREFSLSGWIRDPNTAQNVPFGEIDVKLFDGVIDVTDLYLIHTGGSLELNRTGTFNVQYQVDITTPAKFYQIQVWYNGTFLYTSPNNDNNPYDFYLTGFSNFSEYVFGATSLEVRDPADIEIFLNVEGNPTRTTYDDGNPPEVYKWGQVITLDIQVNQSGIGVNDGILTVYDTYNGSKILDSYTYVGGDDGYKQFTISTTGLFAGLHQLRVEYIDGLAIFSANNITYIVINESIDVNDVFLNGNYQISITRGIEGFTVYGNLSSLGVYLRNLKVQLTLVNNSFDNVSQYLNIASRFVTINSDGTYQFDVSSLYQSIPTPPGFYGIRVHFFGTIDHPAVQLHNFMVSKQSLVSVVYVSAGTNLIPDTYWTELDYLPEWWSIDMFYANGTLLWDNGSAIQGELVNVSVRLVSDGSIIAFNATEITDINGNFEVSLYIGDYPAWPDYESETEIWVEYNGKTYIIGDIAQYT
ncbi:MAG: transglutaminase-like domain-containing protein [Promethearchaeota archaeon]